MAQAFQPDARLPGGGYWFDDQTGNIDETRNSVLAITLWQFGLTQRPTQNAQTGQFEPTQPAPRQPGGRVPPSGIDPNRPLIGQGPLSPTPTAPAPAQGQPGSTAGAAADRADRAAAAAAAAGAPGAPAAQPLRTVDRVVGAYAGQHGNPVSLPSKADEFIADPEDPQGPRQLNPNPTFHYTFPDGFQLDITLNGEVVKETEPSAARTRATEPVQGPGGTQYKLNPATGQYELVAPTPGTPGAVYLQSQTEQVQASTIASLAQTGLDNATAARVAQMTPAEVQEMYARGALTRAQATIALAKLSPEIEQTRAQTGLTGAQTARTTALIGPEVELTQAQRVSQLAQAGLDNATAARVAQMTPAEIAEMEARGELTRTQAAIARAKAQPEIEQIQAQTDLAGAQARAQDALNRKTNALLPSDIAKADADIAKAYQDMAEVAQRMNRPVPVQAGTEAPVLQYITPDGRITSQRNEAFLPTTMAGVAALTGQLRGQGQQLSSQLEQQVAAGVVTREQADRQLNDWYAQNQPIAEQAQQQILREQERLDMARRESAVTAAQQMGTQAISAFQAEAPYLAGPGYGGAMATALNALGQGREVPEGTFRPEMFTAPPVNLAQQARDATMEALKLISPTAAAATGSPLPQLQGLDIGALLRGTAYGSTQPQAWGGAPPQQGQGQAQQPITINIGGAQQPQQQAAPTVPEPFVPRSPIAGFGYPGEPSGVLTPATPLPSQFFQQAQGIGPQLPPQVTPSPSSPFFQQAQGIGPQLPPQVTAPGTEAYTAPNSPMWDILRQRTRFPGRYPYQPRPYQPGFPAAVA